MALTEQEKQKQITNHLKEIFKLLNVDLKEPEMGDTPKRIASMWKNEIFRTYKNDYALHKLNNKMTLFDAPKGDLQPITLETSFNSWCEHHLLPFFGKIKVTYLPDEKIVGLSKIPRVIEYFSKKPQLQERLGIEIAEYLMQLTEAHWVEVEIFDTTHTCVKCRGVEYEANTSTKHRVVRLQYI